MEIRPIHSFPALISIILLALVVLLWKTVNRIWIRPKKKEKLLRKQGFGGNPYKLIVGDVIEAIKLTRSALQKPISMEHDHLPRILSFVHHTIKKHGQNCFAWVGPTPWLIITDAEMIKNVITRYEEFQKPNHPVSKLLMVGLFGLEGETWARHRRIINPAFHMEKLKSMFHLVYESCSMMISSWEEIVDGSTEIDVWPYLLSLSEDVLSRVAFGSNHQEGRRICELQTEQVNLSMVGLQISNYIPGWRFLPTKKNRRVREICKELEESLTRIIDSRRKEMEAGVDIKDDLLGVLLESNMREMKEKNRGLTTKEVVEECRIFYLAGSETTSTLLVCVMGPARF